jgi:hypothetical protein
MILAAGDADERRPGRGPGPPDHTGGRLMI